MPDPLIPAAMCCSFLLLIAFCFSETTESFGQRRSPFVCKQTALNAVKPPPELIYNCGELPNDSLKIVKGNTLAANFFVYRDNGFKLSRKVLRWNGNVYS